MWEEGEGWHFLPLLDPQRSHLARAYGFQAPAPNSSLLSPRLGVSVQEPSGIWAQLTECSGLSGEGVDEVAKEFWDPKGQVAIRLVLSDFIHHNGLG